MTRETAPTSGPLPRWRSAMRARTGRAATRRWRSAPTRRPSRCSPRGIPDGVVDGHGHPGRATSTHARGPADSPGEGHRASGGGPVGPRPEPAARYGGATCARSGPRSRRRASGSRASAAYADARQTFLLLFAQGLNDTAAASLIDNAGPLFAEAAYAAAQLGETEKALTLASEGRARLMAAALKLQTLDLPADKRQRLDELRADIRIAERTVEAQTTQGTERAAAVERLVSLRQELTGPRQGRRRRRGEGARVGAGPGARARRQGRRGGGADRHQARAGRS